jgi:hypothetical protein
LAKLKKLVHVFKKVPHLTIPDATKLAKYSDEEVSDGTFQCFLLRALPGGLLNGFRALLARDTPPPKQQCQKRAINDNIKRTPPPVKRTPPLHPTPNHHKMMLSSTIAPPNPSPNNVCNDGRIRMLAATTKKCKQ